MDPRPLTTCDSKLRLTMQNSTDMQNWSSLSIRTGTGGWSINPVTTTALNRGRMRFIFNAPVVPCYT
ncbi:MAG TPA: hypothetical protein VHM91_12860 [Verrucomicrobiales bacterium]|nr:hypothetical protein [Verrucomicrobiales bacterium]